MSKRKILFIAAHRRDRAPGQRFRFEQYFDFLEKNDFQCELSYIISKEDDKIFYSKGNYFKKASIAVKAWIHRLNDTLKANEYDIIFIFREAFMTGSILFEKQFAKSKAKIVFDFDDAIWIDVISGSNKSLSWLKDANKTSKIINLCDLIIAGNDYLAEFARKHNNNVVIIPTTIDTASYTPSYSYQNKTVTIGWSGSVSTIEHFEYAIPALKILKEKYKNKIEIKVIGDANYKNKDLGIQGFAWKSETEVKDLQTIDIGIMPLPDNEWTWGKCGLKGLQYMALEIPTVMSPVGVNKEIIRHGMNGFLANSTNEWVAIISNLVENPDLRIKIGKEGRKTVIEKYSVNSQKSIYLNHFKSLIQ